MNNSKAIFRLTQQVVRATRQASTNTNTVPSPYFARLKKLQEKFGTPDSTPVHLKGGFTDRLLFITTAGLVTVGTCAGIHVCYTLIMK